MGAQELADHLKNCRKVDFVIAGDGNLDEVVETMLAAGWTYGSVEYVEAKRVRYLTAPEASTAQP